MLLTSRKSTQCVFCTFAESERLVAITPTCRYRSYGRASVRSFGSASPNGLRRAAYQGKSSWENASNYSRDSQRFGQAPRSGPAPRPGQTRYNVDRIREKIDYRDRSSSSPQARADHDHFGGVRRRTGRDVTATGRDMFGHLLEEQVSHLERGLRVGSTEVVAWGIESREELKEKLELYRKQIDNCVRRAKAGAFRRDENPLFFRLRDAFLNGSTQALALELKYALLDSVVTSRLPRVNMESQKRLADLRHPIEWYPATRAMHRTVHLHVGPTNSGKTYHALKRLEAAQSGIYAGPLRLLAHEVYTRMNALGKKCALVTGEERRIPEDMVHQMSSCTVEMVPLNTVVEVAVIDEIQMMGDWDRGWAWTQAFLGVKAKEVHLCGEVRTVELITDLCKIMGDELVVHRYERLSPLETQNRSLGHDLSKLEKGDAVILFSRVGIHAMKAAIEAKTKRRCAVVYGSLPPETRAQQAALFNDPDNDYDFLVASDAVGMGLNLSIKRVIFESVAKFNGSDFQQIPVSEIKQIAGRAGRYKTARDAVIAGTDGVKSPVDLGIVKKKETNRGYVTTLDDLDLPIVETAMKTDVEPMKTAGIFPPSDILVRFASYFPADTPFSYIVIRLHDLATHGKMFQMCHLKDQVAIADLIQPYKLSVQDRITFMAAPMALREQGFATVLKELAECVSNQCDGELLDLKSMNIELLAQGIHEHRLGSKGYLKEAEFLHKALTLYLWLSYRFSGIFRSQALAFHVKALTEEKIDQCLHEVQWDEETAKQRNQMRRESAQAAAAKVTQAAGDLQEDLNGTASGELEALEGSEAVDTEDSPSSDGNIPTTFDGEEREVDTATFEGEEEGQYIDSSSKSEEDLQNDMDTELETLFQVGITNEDTEPEGLPEDAAVEASEAIEASVTMEGNEAIEANEAIEFSEQLKEMPEAQIEVAAEISEPIPIDLVEDNKEAVMSEEAHATEASEAIDSSEELKEILETQIEVAAEESESVSTDIVEETNDAKDLEDASTIEASEVVEPSNEADATSENASETLPS